MRYIAVALVSCLLTLGVVNTLDSDNLPPCATEDSPNCYWDSDTMGNGLGNDLVNR